VTRLLLTALLLVGCQEAPASPATDGYFLVGRAGATALDGPAAHGGVGLLPGSGMAIVEQRLAGGRRMGRTTAGRWIAMSQLIPARPAALAGVALGPGAALDFAWVVTTAARLPLFTRQAPVRCQGDRCATPAGPMRAADLRIPTAAPRPAGVGATERWIDVELASQTLVAYQGDTPLYATLVSTGIGGPGSPLSTPAGVFRIRSKHLRASMDNLEHTGVVPYSYQDIPLVQYFTDRVALHAALWHQRFGHPASHGCINLAPADAAWMFAFTSPRLPGTATDAWARPGDGATVLRVR
jgi:lipoprotein-anchoring transpeptidase ErfK/SrfK